MLKYKVTIDKGPVLEYTWSLTQIKEYLNKLLREWDVITIETYDLTITVERMK